MARALSRRGPGAHDGRRVPRALTAARPTPRRRSIRARRYAVRAATEHPILEHDRVRRFRALLADGAASDDARASWASSCTNRTRATPRAGSAPTAPIAWSSWCARPARPRGLYGAKITGGGSGGTVAVVAAADLLVQRIAVLARHLTRSTGSLNCRFVPPTVEPHGHSHLAKDIEPDHNERVPQLVGRDTETGALVRYYPRPPDWSRRIDGTSRDGPSEFAHWLLHTEQSTPDWPYPVADGPNGHRLLWTGHAIAYCQPTTGGGGLSRRGVIGVAQKPERPPHTLPTH